MIIIRNGARGDESAVVRLVKELGENSNDESPVNDSFVQEYFRHSGCGILLAEDDGVVVGLLSYCLRPSLFHAAVSCLIETLIVTEVARSQGAGRALMVEILRRAETQKWAEVSVSVMPDNQRALWFYKLLGLTDEAVLLEKHV
ncbi:MAG: GNAT family N-acetyltransferase [candidate division Zixibacteria bacterium]|nr:GNAT family N-acetyltransferase [candidate division Zixibacteria bacterium]